MKRLQKVLRRFCGEKLKVMLHAGGVLFLFAGVWAREIAAMVGQHIPLVPMKHAYVVTEEVPGGVRNMPNVRDHDSSVYFRVQGDALCVGGYEPNPIILDNVKKFSL
jgi:glycine/D-amino acid oxidase-like deaminating enzyme